MIEERLEIETLFWLENEVDDRDLDDGENFDTLSPLRGEGLLLLGDERGVCTSVSVEVSIETPIEVHV